VLKKLDPESRKRYKLNARYIGFLSSSGDPIELPHFMGDAKLHESALLHASVIE